LRGHARGPAWLNRGPPGGPPRAAPPVMRRSACAPDWASPSSFQAPPGSGIVGAELQDALEDVQRPVGLQPEIHARVSGQVQGAEDAPRELLEPREDVLGKVRRRRGGD